MQDVAFLHARQAAEHGTHAPSDRKNPALHALHVVALGHWAQFGGHARHADPDRKALLAHAVHCAGPVHAVHSASHGVHTAGAVWYSPALHAVHVTLVGLHALQPMMAAAHGMHVASGSSA